MKKKLLTIITVLFVTSCFIACSQAPIDTHNEPYITNQSQLSKPFVEVELTPNTSYDIPAINDGIIMVY